MVCSLSLFDVWCDNGLVCLHMHGNKGMGECGTSWMFHDLRANVWMFGTLSVPKQFKMNAHVKIGDHLSSYCENITRRAKQKAGCRRRSSSRRDKAQTARLSIHNVTTNSPLTLWSIEKSKTHNFHTTKARSTLNLKKQLLIYSHGGQSGDAGGLSMQKVLAQKRRVGQQKTNSSTFATTQCDVI